MELVDGPTLAERIARGPIPLDETMRIATQLAEAFAAADEQGIVHRDLKPANINRRPDTPEQRGDPWIFAEDPSLVVRVALIRGLLGPPTARPGDRGVAAGPGIGGRTAAAHMRA